jgi:hypothetical protein
MRSPTAVSVTDLELPGAGARWTPRRGGMGHPGGVVAGLAEDVDLDRVAAGAVEDDDVVVGAVIPGETTECELELARGDLREGGSGMEEEGLVAAGGGEDVDRDLVGAGVAKVDAEEVRLAVAVEAGHEELPVGGDGWGECGGGVQAELGVVAGLGEGVDLDLAAAAVIEEGAVEVGAAGRRRRGGGWL